MTEIDLSRLNTVLPQYATQGRTALLPVLHAAQEIYGYLPDVVLIEIGRALRIPLAEIYGVVDFYALFYSRPVSQTIIHVCNDPVCALAGADGILKRMSQKLEFRLLQGEPTASISVERAPCLGLCEHAPALLIDGSPTIGEPTWDELFSGKGRRPNNVIGGSISILTSNCGKNRPTSIEEYTAAGGYLALQKALSMGGLAVIETVKESGLVGRGGAAFPTGIKWESAAKDPGYPKYVVCNADEAEPGTFKDRVMMEEDPHRILEGLVIAASAIGASKGYIYIRGEYTYPFQIMRQAVEEARLAGYIGENILNSGFNFDVELRRGAGAYVCGEETALFESIEGKRGMPRLKPPFPVTFGLFGKPTVINNVETLCNVSHIIQHGAESYRKIGTQKSPGSKLFCVSGDVVRPGLYEVPFGTSFRTVLEGLAGGVRHQRQFQAALFGGAAGAFATEKDLDVPLSFEDLRAAGLPLGSGVITVFDQTRDLRDVLLRLAHFFADESCGKCYPCQIGTQRQYEIIQRVANHETLPGDMERLLDIGAAMSDASICGLGQSASSAILSAIRLWPDTFQPDQI